MTEDEFKEIRESLPLGSRRDREFVANVVSAVARHGDLNNDARIEASRSTYKHAYSDKAHLQKANQMLGLSPIREALAEFYHLAAEFTPADAARLHVQHIKGGLKYKEQTLSKDGEIVDLEKETAPNYAALRDYIKMTLEPPKRIEVDQRSVQVRAEVKQYEQPEIGARPIEDVIDVQP